MAASEPLPHFVDALLGYLHETHPTYATLDGVHTHDDLLEDVSRQAVEDETRALAGYLRRLGDIHVDALTLTERLEHKMLASNIRARMFELEEIRTWERNPQYYSDILASSLRRPGVVHACARLRARPASALEAAADPTSDSSRARQHQGAAGDFRQGRHRDPARRPEVHRGRSAARVLERRRSAPPRRSRRRPDGGLARARRVHSRPRNGSGAPGPRLVPPGSRQVRAEAQARRRAHHARRSPRSSRPRAEGDSGSVQEPGRQDEWRRSASDLGANWPTIQVRASSWTWGASSSSS